MPKPIPNENLLNDLDDNQEYTGCIVRVHAYFEGNDHLDVTVPADITMSHDAFDYALDYYAEHSDRDTCPEMKDCEIWEVNYV